VLFRSNIIGNNIAEFFISFKFLFYVGFFLFWSNKLLKTFFGYYPIIETNGLTSLKTYDSFTEQIY
jgi:hypothetical protein